MICIVHVFATAPDLAPAPGAAPWPVLGRQLARELVAMLNGDGDRGARFMPWIGTVDGQRGFLEPARPLPVEALGDVLAGSHRADFLVDGELCADLLRVRLVDGASSGSLLWSADLPLDPGDPWPALRRAAFELGGLLGIPGAPPQRITLARGPLARWFAARDLLLGLEANLLQPDVEAVLAAGRAALAEAPHVAFCRRVLLDLCRALVSAGVRDPSIAQSLVDVRCWDEPGELLDAARVADAAGGSAGAVPLWLRIVEVDSSANEALTHAAAGLFEASRVDEVRSMLRRAVERGNQDPDVRAQLAAVEELGGEFGRRDQLLEGLLAEDADRLSPKTLRLVASWRIDCGDHEAALRLLDRLEAIAPELSGLWLERGRALLALGRALDARRALERCLELCPSDEGGDEARRLLRFSVDDGYVGLVFAVEEGLANGQPRKALRAARRLVARRREFVESWLLLGMTRMRLGHLRRAVRAFRRALRIDPHAAEAHHRIGIALSERGAPEQGYTHLRYAVELTPHDAGVWMHFAQVAGLVGSRDEAERALRRAEELGGDLEVVRAVRTRIGT